LSPLTDDTVDAGVTCGWAGVSALARGGGRGVAVGVTVTMAVPARDTLVDSRATGVGDVDVPVLLRDGFALCGGAGEACLLGALLVELV
jgi:hypothetical protein